MIRRRLRARWGHKINRRRLRDTPLVRKKLCLKRLNHRTFARRIEGAMRLKCG